MICVLPGLHVCVRRACVRAYVQALAIAHFVYLVLGSDLHFGEVRSAMCLASLVGACMCLTCSVRYVIKYILYN